MKVVGFWNDYRVIILKREDKILAFDRISLETCIGRGERIELETGDVVQNVFDEQFVPKPFRIPSWLERKFLDFKKKNHRVS